jgi:hypothetical protein
VAARGQRFGEIRDVTKQPADRGAQHVQDAQDLIHGLKPPWREVDLRRVPDIFAGA